MFVFGRAMHTILLAEWVCRKIFLSKASSYQTRSCSWKLKKRNISWEPTLAEGELTKAFFFVYLMSFRIIFVNSRKTQKSRRQKYKDISSSPNLLFSPASWSTREFAGIHHIHLHWVAIVPEEIHDRSYLKLEPLVFRKIACVERVRT